MAQTQKQTSKSKSTEDETTVEPKKLDTTSDIDDILDAIDGVLEAHTDEEAQAFVNDFRQKGGQ